MYDAQEIQKLVPQLEETIEKKDKLLRQAQSQIESQTKRISVLETEVRCLQVKMWHLFNGFSLKIMINLFFIWLKPSFRLFCIPLKRALNGVVFLVGVRQASFSAQPESGKRCLPGNTSDEVLTLGGCYSSRYTAGLFLY